MYDGDPTVGFEILEPPEPEVATLVPLGDMTGIGSAWQALHAWLEANGYDPCHEVYLRAPGEEPGPDWATKLRQPRRGGASRARTAAGRRPGWDGCRAGGARWGRPEAAWRAVGRPFPGPLSDRAGSALGLVGGA